MIEFGKTLRAAREAKGLTTRDIAEKTHLMVQMVENLEAENFAKIAAAIYGRGFVKLYCEVVGLDPKPLIAEFMDIYNGNREPTIRMREVAKPEIAKIETPAPEIAKTDAPEIAKTSEPEIAKIEPPEIAKTESATPQPPPVATDLFNMPIANSAPAAKPVKMDPATRIAKIREIESAKASEQEIAKTEPPAREQPAFVSHGPARYSAPLPIDNSSARPHLPSIHIPPTAWRLLSLACAAALILWLLFLGARALYNATMTPPQAVDMSASAQETAAPVVKQPTDKSQPREPMKLPALYID